MPKHHTMMVYKGGGGKAPHILRLVLDGGGSCVRVNVSYVLLKISCILADFITSVNTLFTNYELTYEHEVKLSLGQSATP